jgi:hypothetical protein
MVQEFAFKEKALPTGVTWKALCVSLRIMNLPVKYQFLLLWEFFPTGFTLVLLPSMVSTHVSLVINIFVETFTTKFTPESVFLKMPLSVAFQICC